MAKRKSEAVHGASTSTSNGSKSAKRSKKEAPPPPSDIVDETNALEWQDFIDEYVDWKAMDHVRGTERSCCSLFFVENLPSSMFEQCFNLIETTSRKDYEASNWGWHPKRKKREMKEEEMRYIVVRKPNTPPGEDDFEGFLSFMITHDSTPAVPVLYIYEIHLTEAVRGKGLGLHLMNLVESIARKVGVKKVMLTCFLSNTKALDFYKHCGFRKDVCSPGDRKTRNKIVKVDYVIMSKELDSNHINGVEETNGSVVQVMEDDPMESERSDQTDEYPSLEDCPGIMRAWIYDLKQQELLNLGLAEAEKARHMLSSDRGQEAIKHRGILAALFQCLQTRYEAARDLDEILREQMYHLKSQISDVDRMAETLTTAPTTQKRKRKLSNTSQLNEETFDWDKATEQVYSSFYTLLRKAEEVDNRLDDIVEREQEADQREDDLDGREEELDSWENDIHEREKALAEREERLMRCKQRLKRTRGSGSRETEEQYQCPYQYQQYHEEVEDGEGEQVRALPWRQEAPPENKVDLWLHHQTSADEVDVDSGS